MTSWTDGKVWGSGYNRMSTSVRNHISVGMERAYLHELFIDYLHYGVA
jgi:hypothetical protein